MTNLAPARAERWVLISAVLASSMAFIDQTALDVASPRLQADLGMTGIELFWVSNAYVLFLASLLLVGGALGDLYGRKRIFMVGIGIFTVASIACGLAPSAPLLILARAVQGIGGALMVPGSLAIISATFAESRRGAAIGTWSMFSTLTTLIGPLLGGWLAERDLWRAVFLINVPIGAFALFILASRVPESREENVSRRLDWGGAVTITASLALFTLGFSGIGEAGSPAGILMIVGAVIALGLFILIELRTLHPMVPLSLFKNRTFTGTNLLTLLLYAALRVLPFFLGLNLQQIQGYPADTAGFAFLPFPIALLLLSRAAGRWVDRIGARTLLTLGPALAGVGFFMLGLPGQTNGVADYWSAFLPGLLVLGIGMGITVVPLTTAVMGSAPRQNAGAASGINNAVSRVAAVLALTIVGGIALSGFQNTLSARAETLDLTPDERAALIAGSAALGATVPPAGLSVETENAVSAAIRGAFLQSYQLVSVIAAVLAWLSALIAFLMVEPKGRTHNRVMTGPVIEPGG